MDNPFGVESGAPVLLATYGMAVFYDIDRVINRTLVYAFLTFLLGLVYASGVFVLGAVLSPSDRGSDLAVALSTLRWPACSSQRQRGFRERSIAVSTAPVTFSARLREQIDLDALSRELLAVVTSTMQ